MKNYNLTSFLAIISIIIISACNPQEIPLQGNYATRPFEITSTKSIDSIWSNISDLFSANGLPVATIDKKKGFITTAKTSFIPAYSFENGHGELQQPQAWIALPGVAIHNKQLTAKTIYSRWAITVAGTEKGMTTIRIDPLVICTYFPNAFMSMEERANSTGKFEELIASSLIKNR